MARALQVGELVEEKRSVELGILEATSIQEQQFLLAHNPKVHRLEAASGGAMEVLLKPLSHLITAGAVTIIIKTTPEPRIAATPERVVSGEVLKGVKIHLQDGGQEPQPHHQEVITVAVRKPSLLVGEVEQAEEVEVKPLRHPAEVDQVVEEDDNL